MNDFAATAELRGRVTALEAELAAVRIRLAAADAELAAFSSRLSRHEKLLLEIQMEWRVGMRELEEKLQERFQAGLQPMGVQLSRVLELLQPKVAL